MHLNVAVFLVDALKDENIFHRELTYDERATTKQNSSSSSSRSRGNNYGNVDMTKKPTGIID